MASLILKYDLTQHTTPGNLYVDFEVNTSIPYDISINWDDGSPIDNIVGSGSFVILSHTFASAITADIEITFNTVIDSCRVRDGGGECLIECVQFPTNLLNVVFKNAINLTTVPAVLAPTITSTSYMFQGCTSFNQNIGSWDMSNIVDAGGMFFGASLFNQNVGSWGMSNVLNIGAMFGEATAFNQDIGLWNVSSCIDFRNVFDGAIAFNQDIGDWDVSSGIDFRSMFSGATVFNQDIGLWVVSNATRMDRMFSGAIAFNQDIGDWDVSNVTSMDDTFSGATAFNQDISDWDVSNVTTMYDMFQNVYIQRSIYDSMLTKWSALPVKFFVPFNAGTTTQYTCDSVADDSRNDILIASKGWVITDGGCIAVGPTNIYADITLGVPDGGLGTEISPFSKSDLDLYLENNVVDGAIINIRGHLELSDTEPLLFPLAFYGMGPISVEFRGWEIETRGCPIIRWTYDADYSLNTNCETNTWWSWRNGAGYVTATFKNFIIQSNTYFVADVGGVTISTFKDVLFIANDFYVASNVGGGGSGGSQIYLGCTINAENLYIENFPNVALSDCVLDVNNVSVDSISNFYTLNTVTTIDDFLSYITYTILTYYTPVLTKPIDSTLVIPNFSSFVSYYTNKNTLYYKLFNVSDTNSPILTTYRNDNGYNNGLFNEPRLSYGAYSFLGDTPIVPEVFPTSGVIGAFYLGGNYTNVELSNNTLSVTMEPSTNNVSVSMNQKIKDKVYFTFEPVDRNDYVLAQKSFSVDFVGKKRADLAYPNFCECVDTICTQDEIYKYNTPIMGGNPLIVDFVACVESYGIYENFVPIRYNWYFDYSVDPTLSATTDVPYVTHTYCGGYLEGYDVRLCVDFTGK